ncbi:MAG: hypothetical protein P4L51_00080 [Puia sp.]|nr:hypothetical protein [Puia sp.]
MNIIPLLPEHWPTVKVIYEALHPNYKQLLLAFVGCTLSIMRGLCQQNPGMDVQD